MSAFAYIFIGDVPAALRESSAQRIDSQTGATLIAFDGCPLVGQSEPEKPEQIEFPFPRLQALRWQLTEWFYFHGINFTVVM
ncbi:hypothetical protein WL21_32525 [Burkholderia ubonensis]|uniref:hypothetical protein n=1 Tax=Burkholderia ubonensis TaxID=101571 RepID=UPI0007554B9A|nr:hypothetical protein [Burkholderia ubonensis]KVO95547.1 hypothetical protein WJ81_02740 [Burkholderia ubonensis]KVZ58470.1 hypothetical protein WL20_22390 [Burkholderia ubonensis]KVZ75136.1 hypothetical protein WL21_32525 [Burkholderia ubonensis]